MDFLRIFDKTIEIMLINPQNIEQDIEDFSFEVDIYMMSIAT